MQPSKFDTVAFGCLTSKSGRRQELGFALSKFGAADEVLAMLGSWGDTMG
jgi:hypothetical protein